MKTKNKGLIYILTIIVGILIIMLFCSTQTMKAYNESTPKLSNDKRIEILEKQVKDLQNQIKYLEQKINTSNTICPSSTPVVHINTPAPILKNIITSTPTVDKTLITTNNHTPIKPEIEKTTNEKIQNNTILIQTEDKLSNTKKELKINTTITEKSGLSADEIDKLLTYIMTVKYNRKNSKLLGQGKALYEMEQKNNVNVFFTLAVSTFETGWGCDGVANQNNMFAFAGRKGYIRYDSVEDSIINFGDHMRKFYFDKKGLTTVSSVAHVYCPPNSREWIYQVNWLIGFYSKTANEILQK